MREGHHKTKHREGTRSCFYCRKDVTHWQALTWPQIKAIYEYCGLEVPSALCCDECYKKPHEELYKTFWGIVTATECENYRKGRPSIIKDKNTYDLFMRSMKTSGVLEEAQKFVDDHR